MSKKPSSAASTTMAAKAATSKEITELIEQIKYMRIEQRDAQAEFNVFASKTSTLMKFLYQTLCTQQEAPQPKLSTSKFPSTSRDFFINNFDKLKEQFATADIVDVLEKSNIDTSDTKKYATECYKAMSVDQKAALKSHWSKCRSEHDAKIKADEANASASADAEA
jgi:hypothetical protein